MVLKRRDLWEAADKLIYIGVGIVLISAIFISLNQDRNVEELTSLDLEEPLPAPGLRGISTVFSLFTKNVGARSYRTELNNHMKRLGYELIDSEETRGKAIRMPFILPGKQKLAIFDPPKGIKGVTYNPKTDLVYAISNEGFSILISPVNYDEHGFPSLMDVVLITPGGRTLQRQAQYLNPLLA